MSKHPAGSLLRTNHLKYGETYQAHLLEQYKLYVESADRISQRRTTANNYLLTINTFLVTLYGLAATCDPKQCWRILVAAAGILVCISWFALIKNYKNLNKAKFEVIHELEDHLPAALFDREWEIAERGIGKAYKPLTHIEQFIPVIFGGLYFFLLLIVCLW
jgi:hypothetical protein